MEGLLWLASCSIAAGIVLLGIGIQRVMDRCRWSLRGTSKLSRSDPAVDQHRGSVFCLCVMLSLALMLLSSVCFPSPVPTLPQERWQQATDHAAEEEEIQEPHHPGLQDPGSGNH